MISGLEQLDAMVARLRSLANAPAEAARRAAPDLLKVAQAQYGSGEAPDGADWERLKQGGSTPLRELTSEVVATAEGAAVVMKTPEELKFHQGGYYVHHAGNRRLREAQASVRVAKKNADAEALKAGRRSVRTIKRQIRSEGAPVAARRTLPGRRSLPVAWGRALSEAWESTIASMLGGDR